LKVLYDYDFVITNSEQMSLRVNLVNMQK
jgi:hypothetical protein